MFTFDAPNFLFNVAIYIVINSLIVFLIIIIINMLLASFLFANLCVQNFCDLKKRKQKKSPLPIELSSVTLAIIYFRFLYTIFHIVS